MPPKGPPKDQPPKDGESDTGTDGDKFDQMIKLLLDNQKQQQQQTDILIKMAASLEGLKTVPDAIVSLTNTVKETYHNGEDAEEYEDESHLGAVGGDTPQTRSRTRSHAADERQEKYIQHKQASQTKMYLEQKQQIEAIQAQIQQMGIGARPKTTNQYAQQTTDGLPDHNADQETFVQAHINAGQLQIPAGQGEAQSNNSQNQVTNDNCSCHPYMFIERNGVKDNDYKRKFELRDSMDYVEYFKCYLKMLNCQSPPFPIVGDKKYHLEHLEQVAEESEYRSWEVVRKWSHWMLDNVEKGAIKWEDELKVQMNRDRILFAAERTLAPEEMICRQYNAGPNMCEEDKKDPKTREHYSGKTLMRHICAYCKRVSSNDLNHPEWKCRTKRNNPQNNRRNFNNNNNNSSNNNHYNNNQGNYNQRNQRWQNSYNNGYQQNQQYQQYQNDYQNQQNYQQSLTENQQQQQQQNSQQNQQQNQYQQQIFQPSFRKPALTNQNQGKN